MVAARKELIWNGFFCLWQRLKKKHVYWEVASKSKPNVKTSKFLSQPKQAQYYACMTKAWLFHSLVMSQQNDHLSSQAAYCLKTFHSMGFSSKYEEEYTFQASGLRKSFMTTYQQITTKCFTAFQTGYNLWSSLPVIGDFQVSLITVQKHKIYFL